jgi:CRP-like cAMP-binding protein
MQGSKSALERLARLPLFAQCTVEQLTVVDRNTTTVRIRAGGTLMRQGTRGTELAIIVDGFANVYVGDELVASLGPGDVCGEIALLDHRPRSATVIAETEVIADVCTEREFNEMLRSVPSLSARLLEQLAGRLRRQLARV